MRRLADGADIKVYKLLISSPSNEPPTERMTVDISDFIAVVFSLFIAEVRLPFYNISAAQETGCRRFTPPANLVECMFSLWC